MKNIIFSVLKIVLMGLIALSLIAIVMGWTTFGLIVILIVLLLWYASRSVVFVGMDEVPAVGVFVHFGKPVKAVAPGVYFLFWPFQRIKIIPTKQHKWPYTKIRVYTKENAESKTSTFPAEVDITLFFQWPNVTKTVTKGGKTEIEKEKYSLKQWPEEAQKELKQKHGLPDSATEITGERLLIGSYYRMPVQNLLQEKADIVLGRFFEDSILGAIRHVAGERSHQGLRSEVREMEKEIKDYLLEERGNPFYEMQIPFSCFDIEITEVKFEAEAERILMLDEKGEREGREDAHRRRRIAEGRKRAAPDEAFAIETLLKEYLKQGVSPEIAAAIMSGTVEGKGLSLEQLRDMAIFLAMRK